MNICGKHNILCMYKLIYFRIKLHCSQMTHQKQRQSPAPYIMKDQKQTL